MRAKRQHTNTRNRGIAGPVPTQQRYSHARRQRTNAALYAATRVRRRTSPTRFSVRANATVFFRRWPPGASSRRANNDFPARASTWTVHGFFGTSGFRRFRYARFPTPPSLRNSSTTKKQESWWSL